MREPMTHDFRRVYWSHNIEVNCIGDNIYTGFSWSTPGVWEGDEVLWETAYGYARARVLESEHVFNVDDMYKIKCEVVGRSVKKSLKGEFEKDKPFEVEEWIDA